MSNVSRLQDLKGTEHFRHWRQEEVAKIVHCGEPDRTKVAGSRTGGLFSLPSRVRNCKQIKRLAKHRGNQMSNGKLAPIRFQS